MKPRQPAFRKVPFPATQSRDEVYWKSVCTRSKAGAFWFFGVQFQVLAFQNCSRFRLQHRAVFLSARKIRSKIGCGLYFLRQKEATMSKVLFTSESVTEQEWRRDRTCEATATCFSQGAISCDAVER